MQSINFLDPRLPERFWRRVVPCAMSGCWLWTGGTNNKGYGRYAPGRKIYGAHRASYEALVAPIAPGLVIDHRVCKTPCCVNPAHLEVVTAVENWRRGNAPSVHAAARDSCIHGHPYGESNAEVRRTADGAFMQRVCRECRLAEQRARRSAQRDTINAYQRRWRAERKAGLR